MKTQLPGLGGGELLKVAQHRWHIEQLLVKSQREVEVDHRGVVNGQTTNDANQVEPVLLHKTLQTQMEKALRQ